MPTTPPNREAVKNVVELMLDGLRPSDKTLNTFATRAILGVGPALLDELLCRAFDEEIRPGHRARLINTITLLSPGHEQQIDCFDIDRFLDDPSPHVRRAMRHLHDRIRAATPTATPSTTTLPPISTPRRDDTEDRVAGQLVARDAEECSGGPVQDVELCRAAH